MLSAFSRIRPCAQLSAVRFATKKKVQAPAKKVKLLGDVMFENAVTLSEESSLLAQTNSSSSSFVKRVFNPFVLRTYEELQQTQAEAQPALVKLRATTDHILSSFANSKGHKLGQLYRHSNTSTSVARRTIGSNFSDTMHSLQSDKEQQYVASILAITMPDMNDMWREYDQGMAKLLNIDKVSSIDTGLLANHALLSTGQELRMRSNWKTPAALVQMILRRRNQLQQANVQANVFDFAAECNQLDPTNEAKLHTHVEVFPRIGDAKTRESKELERLGLIMQLLATPSLNMPKTAQERTDYNLVGLEATNYGAKVISTLKAPAPLSALKVVWTHAPKCNLPNSYQFYKTFFEQVLYSLTADPLQLVGEEEAVDSLLGSMVASKFKSSALIAKLFEVLSLRGFDYQKIGLKMYGSLVELNALSFASSILNSWVESSEAHFDVMTESSRDSLWIGEKATQMVCEVLVNKTSYSYGDLAVVVTNCGRVHHKNMVHLKVLRDVEAAMTNEIPNLPLPKILALLRVYANTGRNYPPIVEQLCERVNQHVDEMSIPSLNGALWAAARLNLRRTPFVSAGLARVTDNITEIAELNPSQALDVIRLLWTLSVLRKLDLTTFAVVKSLVEQYVSCSPGGQNHDLNTWAFAQLSQAWVEAQTLMREQGIDEQEWLAENATTLAMSHRGIGEVLDRKVKNLPWHSGKIIVSDTDEVVSSRTHLDLSQTLTTMGVPHENEVTLSNGYVADIFIPIDALEEIPVNEADHSLAADVNATVEDSRHDLEVAEDADDDYEVSFDECQGVVLEFDGPSHFESYKRVSLCCVTV